MEVAEKKIFVLVGSRAGMRSNTRELCAKFIAAVGKKWPGSRYLLRVEILTADEWNIGACRSCSSCFQRGNCPSDRLDNMPEIKRKLLECDGLILASPVYAGTVSGDMKILIDRLSGWLHTMPLIGKRLLCFLRRTAITGMRSLIISVRWLK